MTWFFPLCRDSYLRLASLFPGLVVPLILMLGWDIVLRWARLAPDNLFIGPGWEGVALRMSVYLFGFLGNAAFLLWATRLAANPDAPLRDILSFRGYGRFLNALALMFALPAAGGIIVFGGGEPLPHSVFAAYNILNQQQVHPVLLNYIYGAFASSASYLPFLLFLPALYWTVTEPDTPLPVLFGRARRLVGWKVFWVWFAWVVAPLPFLIGARGWVAFERVSRGWLEPNAGLDAALLASQLILRTQNSFTDAALALLACMAAWLAVREEQA